MFKTKIDYRYSFALVEQLKKEFGIEFDNIDCGDYVGLRTPEELSNIGVRRIQTAIDFFKAGIDSVMPLLDEIQELNDLIKSKIERM